MQSSSQARALGYGGLIPFAAALAVLAFGDTDAAFATRALVAYGAVILSFVGAVHWGIGLMHGASAPRALLLVSVVPALLGWLSLLVVAQVGLVLQIVAFTVLYGYERLTLWDFAFPAWYRVLRRHLTAAVVAMLAAALALLVVRGGAGA